MLKKLTQLADEGIIIKLNCSFPLQRRLTSMGIAPRRKIKIISMGKNVLLLETENSTIAIERKIASNILCKGAQP